MHTLAQQRQTPFRSLFSESMNGLRNQAVECPHQGTPQIPTAASREARRLGAHINLLRGDRVGGAHTLASRRERAAGFLVRRCQRKARRRRAPSLRPRVGLRPCQMHARERDGWLRHPCTHTRTRFASSPVRVHHKRRRPLSALLSKTRYSPFTDCLLLPCSTGQTKHADPLVFPQTMSSSRLWV